MRSKIESITVGKAAVIYKELIESENPYKSPSVLIKKLWDLYLKNYENNPSTNGRIFEYLICETLAQEGITPFYYQTKFIHVPNCEFDIVFYNNKKPVVLSVKVSLRERYKQADLEGMFLKQVYRQAKQYLITLSKSEVKSNKLKIKSGDIAGIDDFILANQSEYNQFIDKLKKENFCEATKIMPVNSKFYLGETRV